MYNMHQCYGVGLCKLCVERSSDVDVSESLLTDRPAPFAY